MIVIDEAEAQALKIRFCDHSDRDMIRELLRRKRFRQYEVSASYHSEMDECSDYMKAMREHLLRLLVKQIEDDTTAKPALTTVLPAVWPGRGALTADIVCLVARDPREN